MAQVNSENSIALPADQTRRRFLSRAAGVAAGGTVLALAAIQPASAAAAPTGLPARLPADDGDLLKLEEQFFEQHELATAYDDEIIRLSEIWTTECRRLYDEVLSREKQTGAYLSAQARWTLVADMTECKEHDRLCRLQEPHMFKMDALVRQMWATPALTPEGRRAKLLVALRLLPDEWREVDDNTEYAIQEARQLLIEFVGGEPGEQLRDQFA